MLITCPSALKCVWWGNEDHIYLVMVWKCGFSCSLFDLINILCLCIKRWMSITRICTHTCMQTNPHMFLTLTSKLGIWNTKTHYGETKFLETMLWT